MPSSIIRAPATPNLFVSEKTRHLSKSRPYRAGGKGLIASTNVEVPSPPVSFFLGYSIYPTSWPLCFCVNQNACFGSFGLNPNVAGWRCYGYSKTNWIIKGLDIGRNGYLFVYMNSSLCGTNVNSNQGPAQVVTAWSLNQINSFNNPNLLLPGIQSISQFLLAYIAYSNTLGYAYTPKTLLSKFTNPADDSTIYYITPTPIYFTNPTTVWQSSSMPYAPAPYSSARCIYIFTLFTSEFGGPSDIFTGATYSDLTLTNLSVSNTTTTGPGAILVNSSSGLGPYIYFSSNSGSFTFNAYQDFYQNNDTKISYLPTQLSVTIHVSTLGF